MQTDHPSSTGAGQTATADRDTLDTMVDQAFALYEQGRVEQAKAAFQAVLALDPQEFDALHMLGVITMQARDFAKAISLFKQAIAMDAEVGMAHTNLGIALMESNEAEAALAALDKAVALEPDSVEAHFARGVAQQALKQMEAALASFARVTALQPAHAEGHFNQGTALLNLRRFEEAAASYAQTLRLQPRHVSALINQGHALLGAGRYTEALASYDQAILIQADKPAAFTGRGDACMALQRFEDAAMNYNKALALKPDQPDVLSNRGNALLRLRRLQEAVASYEQALKLAPRHAIALANLSGALRDMGRHKDALARADEAITERPDLGGAHMNRGNALLDLGRVTEASEAFARTIALQPDDVEAQWALGWSSLLAGDWECGLPCLEVRWRKAGFTSRPRDFTQPLWLGDASLQGKTILLHAEQGLGDTIQFCRYVPQVAALGAKVVLEVQAPLKNLVASLAPGAQIVGSGEPLPPFDVHCPLMSLPLAFHATPSNLPAPQAYLRADDGLSQAIAERLGSRTSPRIGLVWSGNAAHRNDAHRSMPLAMLLAALPRGPRYFCLQKDIRQTDLTTLQAYPEITVLPDVLSTFDSTAALIDNLDLVISVDTSVAHLAGALGKPVCILLSRIPDWRWLMDREDTPWYPSARLLRQASWGDWSAPLEAVRQLVSMM